MSDEEVEACTSDPLLGNKDAGARRPEDTVVWQFFHAFFFLLGGTTFIAGTGTYYYPEWEDGPFFSALLYTIGSCGFLAVDTQEFLTFTNEPMLIRTNILCSWTGSLLYVIGSVGFFPVVYAMSDQIGIQG